MTFAGKLAVTKQSGISLITRE